VAGRGVKNILFLRIRKGLANAGPFFWLTWYLHRDYPGSITGISNQSGNLEAEYSYTAWGQLRNPANWQTYAIGSEPELMFGRGYTGHEHLLAFGLINMFSEAFGFAPKQNY